MGDVAQILGINSKTNKQTLPASASASASASSAASSSRLLPPPAPLSHTIPRSIQNTSTILNKSVLKLLSGQNEAQNASSSTLPPIVPSHNLPLQTIKKRLGSSNSNSNSNSTTRGTPTPPPTNAHFNANSNANQLSYVKINNKSISTKKARSWVYAPFANSARNDGLLLHHWVRAGVEYPDYPYARFDMHLEELSYRNEVLEIENANASIRGNASGTGAGSGSGPNAPANSAANTGNNSSTTGISTDTGGDNANGKSEDEINAAADAFYEQYLQNDKWTQTETDVLLEFCRVYELRWPVIIDRWSGKFGSLTSKKVEDLQHRYYTIGYILNRMKVERAAKVEADNLAKAMAATATNQNATSTVSVIETSTSVSALPTAASLNDAKAKGIIQAEHALASAIVSSSSNAINTLIGEVKPNLQPPIPAPNTGTSNQPTFDLDTERQRRKVLDIIWARTKEDELEEIELRNELKLVEIQIRKAKKSGRHILAATAASNNVPNSTATAQSSTSNNKSDGVSSSSRGGGGSSRQLPLVNNNANGSSSTAVTGTGTTANDTPYNMINAQFTTTAPTPTPGTPYLQSGRQKQPATGGQMGINKTTLKRMDQVLQELKIKERPIPTKRVCDLYDHVRKGALMLLTLQKIMLKKESEVVSRRLRLEKMAGGVIQQQEAAATSAAAAAATAATQAAAAAANAEKAKAISTAASKSGKSSGGTKSGSGGNTTSKKGKGSGSGKSSSGTKEKKTKKKSISGEGGTTKKRKSSSKKKQQQQQQQNNDDSAKGQAGTAASSKSASSAGVGTGAASNTKVGNSNSNTGSTKDADGKPAKKRLKKS